MRLLTAMVATFLVASAGCSGRSHAPSAGPLDPRSENRSLTGASVKPGEFLVVGVMLERNESGQDVVLGQVTPDDAARADGLDLRYAAVRLTGGGCRIGAARGWLPRGCGGRVHPVAGFRVHPGADTEILVGARSASEGRWFIKAFRLEYRSGSKRYAATYNQGMRLRVRASSKD